MEAEMINSYGGGGISNVQVQTPSTKGSSQAANDFADRALGKPEIDRRFNTLTRSFQDAESKKDAQGNPLYKETKTTDPKTGEITTSIDMGDGMKISQKTVPGKYTEYDASGPRNCSTDSVAIRRNANGSESLAEMNFSPNGRTTYNSETIAADGSQSHFYQATPAHSTPTRSSAPVSSAHPHNTNSATQNATDGDADAAAMPQLAKSASQWEELIEESQAATGEPHTP